MKTRALSILAAAALLLTQLPATAAAEEAAKAAPAVCTREETCPAESHETGCPRGEALTAADEPEKAEDMPVSPMSSESTAIRVGAEGEFETIAAALQREDLSGDVTIELTGDVTDTGGISIPQNITSLTIRSDQPGMARKITLKTVNPLDQPRASYTQAGNSIFCNGRDLTISKDIILFSGGTHSNDYPMNIFGGSFQGAAEGSPRIRFDGSFQGGRDNRSARLYLYGGGYNAQLTGSPEIIVGGSVSFVTGGGLAVGAAAGVDGSVSITVESGGSIVNGLTGGGEADRESADAEANVTGDVSIRCEEGSIIRSLTGGGYATVTGDPDGGTLRSTANVEGGVTVAFAGKLDAGSDRSMNCGGKARGTVRQPCAVEANVAGACTADLSGAMYGTIIGGGYASGMDSSYYHPETDPTQEQLQENRIHAGVGSVSLTVHDITNEWITYLCAGYAENLYADFSVEGDVQIAADNGGKRIGTNMVSVCGGIVQPAYHAKTVKAWKDTEASVIEGDVSLDVKNISSEDKLFLYGGFYTNHAGNGIVKGSVSTKAENCSIQKLCGAGGIDNAASGQFTEGCGSVRIEGDAALELLSCKTGTGVQYMAGCAAENSGVTVGGNASLSAKDSRVGGNIYMAGSRAAVEGDSMLTLLGDTVIKGVYDRSKEEGDRVKGQVGVIVGDGSTDTRAQVSNYLYRLKTDTVVIRDRAVLAGNGSSQLLWNVAQLEIAETGTLDLNYPQSERGIGSLSGSGTIVLPDGAALAVQNSFSGSIVLKIKQPGPIVAGQTLAYSPLGTEGTFTYGGEGYVLVRTDAESRYSWDLAAAKTVTAKVEGTGGTITPASQSVALGSSAVFTIAPEPGYRVSAIQAAANGEETDAAQYLKDGVLTLPDVQADTEVTVSFEKELSLVPSVDKLRGGGTVTLVVAGVPDGAAVQVTCDDGNIVLTPNADGSYSAALPNSTRIYTFTASCAEGRTAICTVQVTRSGGSTSFYAVNVNGAGNGAVSSSTQSAGKGSTVTLTVKPDQGYELDALTVTDENGNKLKLTDHGDGIYTFLMPAAKVYAEAVFVKSSVSGGDLPFLDVSPADYYYDAVAWAVGKGVANGTSATTFTPDAVCTRAQAVTFLWRAAGSPAADHDVPFTDVNSDSYYYNAVLWAAEKRITKGTSATTFAPSAPCTRGQIVTMLHRCAGSPAAAADASFADVAADAYYAQAVAWAAGEGVTNGTGSHRFSPRAGCARGQIVTFLYRYMSE